MTPSSPPRGPSPLPWQQFEDIARHADVSVESVLRVLNNERVSEDVAARVLAAMDVHGFQPPRASRAAEPAIDRSPELSGTDAMSQTCLPPDERPFVEPADRASEARLDAHGAIEQAREQLLQVFAEAATELETTLPHGMSSVLYEALRVEIRPVAERIDVLDALFNETIGRLQQVRADLRTERNERVEDLTLLVNLITTSWRTIDRRLGRIERKLERMEVALPSASATPRRTYDRDRSFRE